MQISDLPTLLPSDYSGAAELKEYVSKFLSACQNYPNLRGTAAVWLTGLSTLLTPLLPVASNSTLVAASSSTPFATGSLITETVKNGSSAVLPGIPVLFSLSGAAAGTSKLDRTHVLTDSNGVATATVTGTAAGVVTVTATYGSATGTPSTQTVNVTLT